VRVTGAVHSIWHMQSPSAHILLLHRSTIEAQRMRHTGNVTTNHATDPATPCASSPQLGGVGGMGAFVMDHWRMPSSRSGKARLVPPARAAIAMNSANASLDVSFCGAEMCCLIAGGSAHIDNLKICRWCVATCS
jgi:hypothetical protein